MRPSTSPNIATNVPPFLSKLWKIVNDPDTDELISWSSDGHNFIIQNEAQFWYTLLPVYYKHNNMSSFIRQLNMYGFHKISSDGSGLETVTFYHPYFQRNEPNLLKHIKRKIANSKTSTTTGGEENQMNNVDQIAKVLVDVKQLRGRQESVDNQLSAMKQENAALWRELALLRQKHMKQQQIVNKLIHFLVTIVQPSRGGLGGLGVKRRFPLMINDSSHSKILKTDATSPDGPTIHELDPETVALSDSLLLDETPAPTNLPVDSPSSPAQSATTSLTMTDPLDNNDQVNAVDEFLSTDCLPIQDVDEQQLENDIISQAADEYMNWNDLNVNKENDDGDNVTTTIDDTVMFPANPNLADLIINNNSTEASKTVATCTANTITTKTNPFTSIDLDLDGHVEEIQDELDSFKEILFDGGYTLDPSAILGSGANYRFDTIPFQLFNSDEPLDIPSLSSPKSSANTDNQKEEPILSGSELMLPNTVPPFSFDFDNLFEDTSDLPAVDSADSLEMRNDTNTGSEVNTPVVIKREPRYPKKK